MRIIARKTLREFWERHPDAKPALMAWFADVKHANWRTPAEVKQTYRNVSVLPNNRLVFNIKGNTYRLVVAVQYEHGLVFIRFIGSHADYTAIDATSI